MVTYKDIQEAVKKDHSFTPKTCWIAHVRSDYGKTKRKAHNRIDLDKRKEPCPLNKRPMIEETLKRLKVI